MSSTDPGAWQGRVDAVDGDAGRRWHQVVRDARDAAGPGVALLGFACDAGVRRNAGRTGAAAGPLALRRQLANAAWHGVPADALYDAGDVTCREDDLETAQEEFAERATALLRAGHRVIGLGGGHEIAWASYRGIAGALAGSERLRTLGIVNFDAHFDLRAAPQPGQGTSGTPFRQIADDRSAAGLPFRYLCLGISEAANTPALYATASRLGVQHLSDVCLQEDGDAAAGVLRGFVDGCDAIYCTVCLDVLPASAAPGVSAPAALGVPLARVVALLHALQGACRAEGRDKLVFADVAELNPAHDAADQRTARSAARIVYELAGFIRR
jgi:formiminoglutamase